MPTKLTFEMEIKLTSPIRCDSNQAVVLYDKSSRIYQTDELMVLCDSKRTIESAQHSTQSNGEFFESIKLTRELDFSQTECVNDLAWFNIDEVDSYTLGFSPKFIAISFFESLKVKGLDLSGTSSGKVVRRDSFQDALLTLYRCGSFSRREMIENRWNGYRQGFHRATGEDMIHTAFCILKDMLVPSHQHVVLDKMGQDMACKRWPQEILYYRISDDTGNLSDLTQKPIFQPMSSYGFGFDTIIRPTDEKVFRMATLNQLNHARSKNEGYWVVWRLAHEAAYKAMRSFELSNVYKGSMRQAVICANTAVEMAWNYLGKRGDDYGWGSAIAVRVTHAPSLNPNDYVGFESQEMRENLHTILLTRNVVAHYGQLKFKSHKCYGENGNVRRTRKPERDLHYNDCVDFVNWSFDAIRWMERNPDPSSVQQNP